MSENSHPGMDLTINQQFAALITRLINKENLTREEARHAFVHVLNNDVTQMHQGAFLAALTAKKETAGEVAGAWEAIYMLDTTKINLNDTIQAVDNCGTGMDTFKTFNISTAAAILAAAGNVPMARHGARAITSVCGTVDMVEMLGVDVECRADLVKESIETAGIGLFNGMSPEIHPHALGRILSQINFGSTLNIAASLANPALPAIGVRGVYAREMIEPVTDVMKEIGYQNAIILHGDVESAGMAQQGRKSAAPVKGMDEASVCGTTHCRRILSSGKEETFTINPRQLGLYAENCDDLAPENDKVTESRRFARLMNNQENSARKDAVILNAGLIFLAAEKVTTLEQGIELSARLLESGAAFTTLEKWVQTQNRDPETGLKTLHELM